MKKINVPGQLKSLYADYRISGNRYANRNANTTSELGQAEGIFSSTLIETLYLNGMSGKISRKRGHINIAPVKEMMKRLKHER